ncbi:hypothetical protein BU26DRAFT_541735 [Trematosphaeria pertusa]|uniref:Uncharacterized protein n=1 Tax=Trematosphaeria pertusa TaxID=390896 RepID=A0A6A6I7Z5_9PLEO|nr:uncharacterized protein BU26DRAFT_541735 [Trematosphaeria pertusa]KAF2246674.1 hypothetical protein BU26DRAFT_541735 [Trematosphaeria pertusa]
MSTPHAKRRRLNEAAKTLQKPFKSPFRTPLKPNLGSDPPSSDPPEISTPAASVFAPQTTPRVTKPLLVPPNVATPTRALQKKAALSKPSLTREIMQLRNEIQILQQAAALATSSKDEDLLVLIERWRTASRAVAEELFASTRDRVNRMGGVGAWKEREREQKEWRQKREMEEFEAEREAERERLEEARENGQITEEAFERFEEGEEKKEEEERFQCADDDSFTMDMMLKTLNIKLELIGYNKEAQRWDG